MSNNWNTSSPEAGSNGASNPPPGGAMNGNTNMPIGGSLNNTSVNNGGSDPVMNNNNDDDVDDLSNDAEGVWSPDIEQSFQEALAIYPPCGRRKIILSDEGKMYGRNELIARYIKLRTGKTRTRKQVSSHIQVLARRKAKEIQAQLKVWPEQIQDQNAKEKVLQSLSSMSSAQIVSATAMQSKSIPPVPPGGAPSTAYPSYNTQDPNAKEKVLQTLASMSSAQIVSASTMQQKSAMTTPGLAGVGMGSTLGPPYTPYATQIVSATAIHNKTSSSATGMATGGMPPTVGALRSPNTGSTFWSPGGINQDIKPPYGAPGYPMDKLSSMPGDTAPSWQGRSIAGPKLRLVEFSAFLEQQREQDAYHKHLFVHIGTVPSYSDPLLEAVDIRQIYDKFPDKKGGLKELHDNGPQSAFFLVKFWGDLNTNVQDEAGAFYGVTSQYESNENMTIQCSTKVCSFGKQVVEKVETEYGHFENGRFVYRIHRSPMCEYMINFIHKLKHLPEKYMMNSVLENFTILQVITNRETQETLLCIAYVFEVSTSEHGTQHHIYRLVKD
ncbi:hypothetical protein LSH36_220g01005 [Paralvinella palmiformis]|uniref:TEA domain-containing protein n=1 Tax=Paralvinella palmiformis TaxID=53620 RepID=A0AAD9JPC4_9ANNE|nr:hypothetical protein LSH36_220g01005 [Paralvinella palmiformis]